MEATMIPDWLKSAEGFSAAVGGPTRQDTYLVNVQLLNVTTNRMVNLGTWDKMTGGGLTAGATSYRPGGMAPPISLGGNPTTANVVVSRLYRLGRDHDIVQQLYDGVGKAKMVVTKQPLDLNGVTYGRPIVYHGVLDRVTAPEHDSEATGAGLLELEMVVEGFPTS